MLVAFFRLYTALTNPYVDRLTNTQHTNLALYMCSLFVYATVAPNTPYDDIDPRAEAMTDVLCFHAPAAGALNPQRR
jgi:hypothetical protein